MRTILRAIGAVAATTAMMITVTVLTGSSASAAAAGAPCGPAASACVDLSRAQAWLMSNGQVTYGPTPITSGRRGQETPVGRHKVLWKDKNHRSSEFHNAPMPYSVFFTSSGVAFHAGSLRQQSAGCVHLSNQAAKVFFNRLAVGQVVQVVP